MYRGRRPVCRGGRLCPPKTRAPCRAGPACPAGENVPFAAGHMGPALQVISQGAMPTSPRRHLARRSRLGERKRRLLPLPLSALRAATFLAEGGKGRTDCRVASLLAMTALRAVGDGVLQWSAAEQMPLGYDVPPVGADGSVRPVRFAPRAVAKPCSIKKNRPRAVLFCLFRADRSGIRCRYRSRPGCSNSLSASQTRPRSHLPADRTHRCSFQRQLDRRR